MRPPCSRGVVRFTDVQVAPVHSYPGGGQASHEVHVVRGPRSPPYTSTCHAASVANQSKLLRERMQACGWHEVRIPKQRNDLRPSKRDMPLSRRR